MARHVHRRRHDHRFLDLDARVHHGVLVAQTRVESGVHSSLEVALGGVARRAVTLASSRSLLIGATGLRTSARRRRSRRARTRRTRSTSSAPSCGRGTGASSRASTSRTPRTRSASARRSRRSSRRSSPAAGPGDLEAIGITASPCGGCRQWLHEFRIGEVSYRARRRRAAHDHARPSSCRTRGTSRMKIRLRRAGRAAQRRQVDARQRAHRREGRDRLATSRTRRATASAASGRARLRSSSSSTCPAGRSRSTR